MELYTNLERTLQGIFQTVTATHFGIPRLERREGKHICGSHIDTKPRPKRISCLYVLEAEIAAAAHIISAALHIVVDKCSRKARVFGRCAVVLLRPMVVNYVLRDAVSIARLVDKRVYIAHHQAYLTGPLEQERGVKLTIFHRSA